MRLTILGTNLNHHLQEENMRQAMLMNNKNPVNRAPHSTLVIFISHPLEPGWDRRVLFKERVLGAKSVVGERVEVDRSGDGQTRVLGQAGLPEKVTL